MSQKTIDQQRAQHAWEAVSEALKLDTEKKRKFFGSQAKKMPARIVTSGLGQAIVFIRGKAHSKDYSPLLLEKVEDWVLTRLQKSKQDKQNSAGAELIKKIIDGDSDMLRRATDEVLAYMLWVNRFAEAEGLTKDEE